MAAQRRLAPENEAAEFLLGVVVGGLDAFLRDETVERIAMLEDMGAGARKRRQVCAGAKQELDGFPRRDGVPPEDVDEEDNEEMLERALPGVAKKLDRLWLALAERG